MLKTKHTYKHTYIRTTEAYLYHKLTNEPKGSGELKTKIVIFGNYKRIRNVTFFFDGQSIEIVK